MRYDLLQKIAATDPLAALFNQYLKGLSTLAVLAEPSYVTMAEVRTRYANTAEPKDLEDLKHSTRRFFELTVLRNSLHALHGYVLEAIAVLESFFAEYQGDLTRYAVENRLRLIEEYGSDEESDWYRNNEADESEPWKVVCKDDPASLKSYTLYTELDRFFGADTRGEHIGTSGPTDFYPYTTMVQQQSEFSFRKLAEGVWNTELVQVGEDGSTSPIPLADHLEREMNTDIRAADLVVRFNLVLGFCQVIRERYEALAPDDLLGYKTLLACLHKVRDVEFPESLFDDLLNRAD